MALVRLAAPALALVLLSAPVLAAPDGRPAAPAAGTGTEQAAALGTDRSAALRQAVADGRLPLSRKRTAPIRTAAPIPPAAAKPAPAPTTAARMAAPAGPFTFLHSYEGKPTRWNPCQPVPWTFNPRHSPAGGLAVVQEALAQVSARTGLRFDYRGTSSAVPGSDYMNKQSYPAFKPLHIGWSRASESDMLTGAAPGTVGFARVRWTGSFDEQGKQHVQIASAVVVLNAAARAPMRGANSWYTYALHEIAHAVGLGHVGAGEEIMRTVIPARLAGFGPGDKSGLERVGAKAGCLPSLARG